MNARLMVFVSMPPLIRLTLQRSYPEKANHHSQLVSMPPLIRLTLQPPSVTIEYQYEGPVSMPPLIRLTLQRQVTASGPFPAACFNATSDSTNSPTKRR